MLLMSTLNYQLQLRLYQQRIKVIYRSKKKEKRNFETILILIFRYFLLMAEFFEKARVRFYVF